MTNFYCNDFGYIKEYKFVVKLCLVLLVKVNF